MKVKLTCKCGRELEIELVVDRYGSIHCDCRDMYFVDRVGTEYRIVKEARREG